jgi:hypothetical protein
MENPVSVVSGFGARRARSVAFQCFQQFSIALPIEHFFFRLRLNLALSPFLFDVYYLSRAPRIGLARSLPL